MAKISFSGKHVVVTGGGSGIGRALAHEFAHEGAARVSITDIDQDRIDRVLSELRGKGVEAAGYRVDHGSEEETRLWAEKLLGEGVPVDVLCANAGVAAAGMLGSMQMDNWRWVMGVNVMGVAYTIHYLLPSMIERGSGSILITASGAAMVPGPAMGCYNASKAAACSLGETLSIELADKGINVCVICPGIISTEIAKNSRVDFDDDVMNRTTMKNSIEYYQSKKAVDPAVVARDALKGLRSNKLLVVTPWSHVGPAWLLRRLAPEWFNRRIALPKWRKGEMISGVRTR
jgi:short-subunit dehydrogenase